MSRSRKPRARSRSTAAPPAPAPASPPIPVTRWPWLVLGLAAAAFDLTFYFDPRLLWYVGVQHYDVWFADVFALLASNDAVTQGLNPYGPNPLDIFGRPHVYSHWWLGLRHLGLTRADISWLGPAVVVLFWFAALGGLRPSRGRQGAFFFLVLVAPPMLLALDRANNDLIIFLLLTPLVPCLRQAKPWARWLAPGLIAFAAGLKYYPAAAALTLLAAAPPREQRLRLAVGVGALLLVGWSVAPDLAIFGPLAPQPDGWMTFGATSAFNKLGWTGTAPALLCLGAAAALLAWAWRSPRLASWSPAPAQQGDWLRFVLGASLLAGCFFTSANFAYRWVFALWLPPLLWTLATDPAAPGPARRLATVTGWLLLAVLWLDAVFSWVAISCRGRVEPSTLGRWIKWSFVAEQPVTWAFFACLLVFLARFTKEGLRSLAAAPASAA